MLEGVFDEEFRKITDQLEKLELISSLWDSSFDARGKKAIQAWDSEIKDLEPKIEKLERKIQQETKVKGQLQDCLKFVDQYLEVAKELDELLPKPRRYLQKQKEKRKLEVSKKPQVKRKLERTFPQRKRRKKNVAVPKFRPFTANDVSKIPTYLRSRLITREKLNNVLGELCEFAKQKCRILNGEVGLRPKHNEIISEYQKVVSSRDVKRIFLTREEITRKSKYIPSGLQGKNLLTTLCQAGRLKKGLVGSKVLYYIL